MIRSPFFYVGDKYKLMPQLLELFPKNITTYVEPFLGGGSSMMSVDAEEFILNDVDSNIVFLHKFLLSYCNHEEEFFNNVFEIIEEYGFSISFKCDSISPEFKKMYPKTYYAKFNKYKYEKLKQDFNNNDKNNLFKLYLLLIYEIR